ncbi:hypothetical protein DJ68_19510 [Halorubrum sp. C3]|nr:hypothetical protein DJ68_19510 [Halorubrum sp. C3]
MSTGNEQHGTLPDVSLGDAASFIDRLLVRLFQLSTIGLVLVLFLETARNYGDTLLLAALGLALLLAAWDTVR